MYYVWVIRDGVVELTERGRWLAAISLKSMGRYIEKLGIDPDMMKMRDMWREPATQ